jgi:hypothetical protein
MFNNNNNGGRIDHFGWENELCWQTETEVSGLRDQVAEMSDCENELCWQTETEVSGLRDQVAEMARELNALIIDKADKREVRL